MKFNNCIQCNSETTNPKFCSRSCSVTFSNNNAPKRLRKNSIYECLTCGEKTKTQRKYCDSHSPKVVHKMKTLKDFDNTTLLNYHSRIRCNARIVYKKSGKPYICQICSYDKHVEICHIISVSQFSKDTLVTEVNKINNLIALCPNHHWEFDNNLIDLVSNIGVEPILS